MKPKRADGNYDRYRLVALWKRGMKTPQWFDKSYDPTVFNRADLNGYFFKLCDRWEREVLEPPGWIDKRRRHALRRHPRFIKERLRAVRYGAECLWVSMHHKERNVYMWTAFFDFVGRYYERCLQPLRIAQNDGYLQGYRYDDPKALLRTDFIDIVADEFDALETALRTPKTPPPNPQ